MRRLLSPFVILFTLLILICYFYAAHQLTPHLFAAILFALPFLSIWLVPILYWFGDQSETHPWTHRFQSFAYLSMGWLNYVFVSLIPLNLLSLLFNLTKQKDWATQIDSVTAPLTFVLSFLALGLGLWRAKRRCAAGPLRQSAGDPDAVEIALAGRLARRLRGWPSGPDRGPGAREEQL